MATDGEEGRKKRLDADERETTALNVAAVRRDYIDSVKLLAVVWNSTFEYALDQVLAAGVAAFRGKLAGVGR